jgi:hypothetical protein
MLEKARALQISKIMRSLAIVKRQMFLASTYHVRSMYVLVGVSGKPLKSSVDETTHTWNTISRSITL